MKVKTVLCDMDGVLCDFHGEFCRIYGYDEKLITGWDMSKCFGISFEELKSQIDSLNNDFWANLPKLEWADKLIDLIDKYRVNVYICSSPAKNSHSGKQAWIDKHYPEFSSRLILIKHKWLLAKEDRLLIDDAEYQTLGFGKHGGYPLTFPRPWNYNRNVENKLWFVENYLNVHGENI